MIGFRVSLFYWDDCQAQRVDFNSFYFLLLLCFVPVKSARLYFRFSANINLFCQTIIFSNLVCLLFCVVLFSSLAAAWTERIIFICSVDLNYSTFFFGFFLRLTNEASRLRKPRLCLHFLLFFFRIYHTDLNSLHATAVVMIIILSVFYWVFLFVFWWLSGIFDILYTPKRITIVYWDFGLDVPYQLILCVCFRWWWCCCCLSFSSYSLFGFIFNSISRSLSAQWKFYNFCFISISFLLFFSFFIA